MTPAHIYDFVIYAVTLFIKFLEIMSFSIQTMKKVKNKTPKTKPISTQGLHIKTKLTKVVHSKALVES